MKKFLVLISAVIATANIAKASGDEGFYEHFNHQNGVAIHGYDVVSYFEGKAEQGSPNHKVNYEEVTFQFTSKEHAKTFDRNPEKYLPAYGGWCATAIGEMNQKLDITPDSYLIQDGILYLFSTSMGPAKEMWEQKQPTLKTKADENWAKIIAE